MSKGGIGSALIVLVFTVLCLTIFTVISLVPALTGQRLIEAEVELVKSFYEADTLAEQVVAEILAAQTVPGNVLGVEIKTEQGAQGERVSFTIPIAETRLLYVVLAIGRDHYEILTWRMYQTRYWEADDRLNVWPGASDVDFSG